LEVNFTTDEFTLDGLLHFVAFLDALDMRMGTFVEDESVVGVGFDGFGEGVFGLEMAGD
jgi:hypothetical protein